jgi:diguanylate cyclase (GGDEF)-like protein/PAS domain S-box-containing protein
VQGEKVAATSTGRRADTPDRQAVSGMAEAIVAHARDALCVFRTDGTIVYLNEPLRDLLGWDSRKPIPGNLADHVHAEDLERAWSAIQVAVEHRPRLAPTAFRVRHADGHWLRVEVNGNSLAPQFPDLMAIVLRASHDADLYSAVLERIIEGRPLATLMATVPRFTIWRNDDWLCTVTWTEEDGTRRAAGSPLPRLLTGVQHPPEGTSPWLRALRTRSEVIHETLEDLPPSVRHAADAHGLRGCWVIPVVDPGGGDTACITLWSAHESAPVRLAEYSARIAEQLVQLILQWRHQQRLLEHAAQRDGLTGLANREAFFRQLDRSESATPTTADPADGDGASHPDGAAGPVDAADAILYVDLDGFKPINDQHGHGAGDDVLVELAERLRTSVRPGDLAARLGGDEFAVLVRSCTSDEAQAVAHRVRERVAEPITVDGHTIRLSASIGVARGSAGDTLLEAADRAQIAAKQGGGNRVRWAS